MIDWVVDTVVRIQIYCLFSGNNFLKDVKPYHSLIFLWYKSTFQMRNRGMGLFEMRVFNKIL